MKHFGREFKYLVPIEGRFSDSIDVIIIKEFGFEVPIYFYENPEDNDGETPYICTDKVLFPDQLEVLQACLKYNWNAEHLDTRTALRCIKNREYCDNIFVKDHYWVEYREMCEKFHGVFAWADDSDFNDGHVDVIFQEWKTKKGY